MIFSDKVSVTLFRTDDVLLRYVDSVRCALFIDRFSNKYFLDVGTLAFGEELMDLFLVEVAEESSCEYEVDFPIGIDDDVLSSHFNGSLDFVLQPQLQSSLLQSFETWPTHVMDNYRVAEGIEDKFEVEASACIHFKNSPLFFWEILFITKP